MCGAAAMLSVLCLHLWTIMQELDMIAAPIQRGLNDRLCFKGVDVCLAWYGCQTALEAVALRCRRGIYQVGLERDGKLQDLQLIYAASLLCEVWVLRGPLPCQHRRLC